MIYQEVIYNKQKISYLVLQILIHLTSFQIIR